MELTVVPIVKPEAANSIFGQSHFIKTVEDLHEALVGAVPGIRFGLAFCEASGKRLVRWSGNDETALSLARDNALTIGAGHTFLIFLGDGFFPVNVLGTVRAVPEVCRIYCATANPTQVIVAQTELGRGVLGVVDGASPLVSKPTPTLHGGKTCCERLATSCSGQLTGLRGQHRQA
jgi:adenosine/AMP kinase